MTLESLKHSTLVPTDFSQSSTIALKHASFVSEIADDDNHSVTLLYVVEGADWGETIYYENTALPTNRERMEMVKAAKEKLQKMIDDLSQDNKYFNYIITGGKPHKKIVEIAAKIKADSVVMGTNGPDDFGQKVLGSNAARVIQNADCPTVVIRKDIAESGYRNIVLPLDFSRSTKQKVNWAINVARYFKSTVHIVSVAETDEFLKNKVNSNIHQVKEIMEDYDIEVTTTALKSSGNFAHKVLDFATTKSADLIVIMSQQENSLMAYLFGSFAQTIVNESETPVMVVNPKANLRDHFVNNPTSGSWKPF